MPDGLSGVLLAFLLVFELSSVPLPWFGYFSAGAACSLALVIHSGGVVGALAGTAVLLLRWLAKSNARDSLALMADLLPLLLASLVAPFELAVPVVYLIVQALLLRYLSPLS